ncbi:MAG: CCA tRNA nucleotidyltransferase [Acidimicrobiales bacterium]
MSELPPGLDAVIERAGPLTRRFVDAGHRLYFVGGVVRDHLLERSRSENDLDATTDARPPRIKALVADVAEAVWTQGERFGTIGCTVDGQVYEITTHRAESYEHDSRKPTVVFGDRIDDDLARRDFTVNAMAVDLADGTLVDPHGGRADLAAGVLRTPLDPEVSFSEDPLRMLRAARFHAGYDLTPTPELTAAITTLLDRMEIVSVERIRDELQKLLLLDDPGPGFRLLAETGLLARVLPTLGELSPAEAEDRGHCAGAVRADAAARWAALLAPEGITASVPGSLRFSGALTRDVIWFASGGDWVSDPGGRPPEPPRIRRDAAMVPSERALGELLDWVAALRTTRGLPSDDIERYREAHRALLADEPDLADPAPLLTGEAVCAVLGIEPGREVGVAMTWLRELRLDEGPVDAPTAVRRLQAWWPNRPDARS